MRVVEPVSGMALLERGLKPKTADAVGRDAGERRQGAWSLEIVHQIMDSVDSHDEGACMTEHDAFVQTLRTRQRVEFAMAILEDFPELVINIVFAVNQSNQPDAEPLSIADISLLIFGAVLSLYHIAKCIMTYFKFRDILEADDEMTGEEALACVESDAKVKYGHRQKKKDGVVDGFGFP